MLQCSGVTPKVLVYSCEVGVFFINKNLVALYFTAHVLTVYLH